MYETKVPAAMTEHARVFLTTVALLLLVLVSTTLAAGENATEGERGVFPKFTRRSERYSQYTQFNGLHTFRLQRPRIVVMVSTSVALNAELQSIHGQLITS